ncbi:MAG: UDP-N-acetylmuramoyl-tripeptide--D-alanyl-D-alanine ligase [Firmicutes bacterium]|nr:UDP-N-acetylmuramoyl-tripeptide--D-alanyl-D-alanine ligase [Bacillota bacterium]
MNIQVSTLAAVVNGRLMGGDPLAAVTSACIDSRKVAPGSLFVAFKGENTDGHLYLEDCLGRGAVAALVEKAVEAPEGLAVIHVQNTLIALQELAAWWRRRFALQAIGVTGSSGKTTTKELIAAVVEAGFTTIKTLGNHNNEIGLPLRMLDLDEKHQVAVLEMGMDARGQIARLCEISQPGIGVITNIGDSHLEKLGSRENIRLAKMELAHNLTEPKILIVNGDDPFLRDYALDTASDWTALTYGFGRGNNFRAGEVKEGPRGVDFTVFWDDKCIDVSVPMPGDHNVLNALAAFTVGIQLGMEPATIVRGLETARNAAGRLNIKHVGELTVIDDSYNSNPDSVRAAFKVLLRQPGKRHVAFVGDMLELGSSTETSHYQMGQIAANLGIDLLVAVGDWSETVATGALAAGLDAGQIQTYTDSRAASAALAMLKPDDVVLFKGSRGIQMETLVALLENGGQK